MLSNVVGVEGGGCGVFIFGIERLTLGSFFWGYCVVFILILGFRRDYEDLREFGILV